MKFSPLIFVFLVFSSCGDKALELSATTGNEIQGSVENFSSSFALSTEVVGAQSFCTTAKVSLHSLNSDGTVNSSSLLESSVSSSGEFQLSETRNLGVKTDGSDVNYVIRVSGCGKFLYRPLTGFKNQVLSYSSTILVLSAALTTEPSRRSFHSITKNELSSAISSLAAVSGTDLLDYLNHVIADATLSSQYQSVTGVSPATLKDLPPIEIEIGSPSIFAEGSSASLASSQTHWNSSYNPAYEWKIDDSVVATTSGYSYIPTKNSQGSRILTLKVGKNDGSGGISSTAPAIITTKTVIIPNTYPPVAPAISLVGGNYVNSRSGLVSVLTGALRVNCETFSKMALTESAIVPPVLPSSYSLTCTDPGTQSVPFLLSDSDGTKTLALWTMDASGNISTSATTVSLTLDREAPLVHITSPANGSRATGSVTVSGTCEFGSDVTISGAGLASSALTSCSAGGTFSQAVSLTAGETSKTIQASQTDTAGNVGSEVISIIRDNTPPTLTILSSTMGASPSSSASARSITFGGTDVTAYKAVLTQAADCSLVNPTTGVETSIATPFSVLPSVDSPNIVCAIGRDSAGNWQTASLASSVLVVDSSAPTRPLSLTHSASHNSTSASPVLTWTASEEIGQGSGFDHYEIAIGSTSGAQDILAWTAVGSSLSTTVSASLAAYLNVLVYPSVRAVDVIGHASVATTSGGWYVGIPDVLVTVTSLSENSAINLANFRALNVSGTCTHSGRDVTISLGALSATTTCLPSHEYQTTIDTQSLTAGAATLTVTHSNNLSISDSKILHLYKDVMAPTVAWTSPSSGSDYNTASQSAFVISGSCSESGQNVNVISSYGLATQAPCVSGTFGLTLNLSNRLDVALFFTATQIDVAGNPSLESILQVKNSNYQTVGSLPMNAPQSNSNIIYFTFGASTSDIINIGNYRADGYRDVSVLKTDRSAWSPTSVINGSDGAYAIGNLPLTYLGQTQKIVYARSTILIGSTYQIWTMGVDGTNDHQITGLLSANKKSSVTRYIVNSSQTKVIMLADFDVDERFELYSMNTDGTGLVKISQALVAGGDVTDFKLSPDGQYVVYIADGDIDGASEIYSAKADGSTVVKLNASVSSGRGVHPTAYQISPDSSRVAYISNEGMSTNARYQLYTSTIDGSSRSHWALANTVTVSSVFSFSPDSTKIAALSHPDGIYRIYVLPVNLSSATNVSGSIVTSTSSAMSFWSPNSSQLALLQSSDAASTYEMYVVNADGTGRVKVSGSTVAKGRVFLGNSTDLVTYHRFTPDGTKLIFQMDRYNDVTTSLAQYQLYSVNIDGTNLVNLSSSAVAGTTIYTIDVSADQSQVVYSADRDIDGMIELYTVKMDGTGHRQINPDPERQTGLTYGNTAGRMAFDWPNDKVYFLCSCDTRGWMNLYSSSISTVGAAQIYTKPFEVNDADVENFLVSPDGQKMVYRATTDGSTTRLYVSRADGSNPVELTPPGSSYYGATNFYWSPNSDSLLFLSDHETPLTSWQLYAANSDGSNVHKLSGSMQVGANISTAPGPTYTPDG